ncbi:hypothetical protein C1N83_24755 [Priestia aryabhattai]
MICGWKKNNKKSSKVFKALLLFLLNIFKLNYVLNKQYKMIFLLIIPNKHHTSPTQASKKLLNVQIVQNIYIYKNI